MANGKSTVKTILVLAANPKDTSRLRLDQEVREIENGLQRAKKRDEFVLKQVWAARPVDVRRAMLDLKPNIVHFCGHGLGEDGIAFENELGVVQLVTSEALAGFFELFSDKLECMVLNACYSESQAQAIAKHIKYVIGMKKGVSDSAAIEFAVGFYDTLGAGESVEFAYKVACNAIQWANLPENLTPILKTNYANEKQSLLIYDSFDDIRLEGWTVHSSIGIYENRVNNFTREPDGATIFELRSFSTESVGFNRSLRILHGKVEFEYNVINSGSTQPNIYFCMIPMQETSVHRSGLIEVGTDIQGDPRNPYSLYRKRFYLPMEHYGDKLWHTASMFFDFRQTSTAFYSIFAPRINEGCSQPASAHFLTANIRVYSLE